MYQIRMKNCAFFARHGVFDEEEMLGQRFYVDAVLSVDPGRALEDDSIQGTVDYGVAFQVIEKIVTGERRFLIEALALEVGKALTQRRQLGNEFLFAPVDIVHQGAAHFLLTKVRPLQELWSHCRRRRVQGNPLLLPKSY